MDVDRQVQEALTHASRTAPIECLLIGPQSGDACFLTDLPKEDNKALMKCLSDELLEVVTDEDDKESPETAKLTPKGIRFLLEHTDTAAWTELINDTEKVYRNDVLSCANDLLADYSKDSEQTKVTLELIDQRLIASLSEECRLRQRELNELNNKLDTLYETYTASRRSANDSQKEEDEGPPQPKTEQESNFIKSVLSELIVIWEEHSEGSETRSAIERALTNLGATKCHSRDDTVPFDHTIHQLIRLGDLKGYPDNVLIADPGWSFANEVVSMTLRKAKAIPINTGLDGTNDTSDHQSASTDDESSNDPPVLHGAASVEVSNSSTQTPDNDTQLQTPNPESITQTDVDCSTKPPPPVNEGDSSD
tara:strand:+ start:287 stop:1381 length:1095 start_codon:yes stop_codon:yes gene_type:complete